MTKEELKKQVEEIMAQLLATTKKSVVFSWGITKAFCCLLDGNATLALHVSARLFEGLVLISYSEAGDYYIIHLVNDVGTRLLKSDVMFDEMGMVIDHAIESGDDAEEYSKFCKEEYKKLLSGQW